MISKRKTENNIRMRQSYSVRRTNVCYSAGYMLNGLKVNVLCRSYKTPEHSGLEPA